MGARAVLVPEEYLPSEKASQRLGKSERSLQRLAKVGVLRYRIDGKKRLYHAGDLDKIISEGIKTSREEPKPPNQVATVASRPPTNWAGWSPTAPQPLALTWDEKFLDRLNEIAKMFAPKQNEPPADQIERVPIDKKLWLSLDEAAAYSGLARADLLQLCQMETPPFVVRKSGGWKIRRASLEAFTG